MCIHSAFTYVAVGLEADAKEVFMNCYRWRWYIPPPWYVTSGVNEHFRSRWNTSQGH